MTEALVDEIADGYAESALPARHKAAIAFADAFLDADGPPAAEVQELIGAELTPEELVEVGIGMALFHGFSKLLIVAGAEIPDMPTTILPTPS